MVISACREGDELCDFNDQSLKRCRDCHTFAAVRHTVANANISIATDGLALHRNGREEVGGCLQRAVDDRARRLADDCGRVLEGAVVARVRGVTALYRQMKGNLISKPHRNKLQAPSSMKLTWRHVCIIKSSPPLAKQQMHTSW
jgi:hypothetical protein